MDRIAEYVFRYIKLIHFSDILDVLIVAFVLYNLIRWVKETRAMQLIKGIIIIFVILVISDWAKMTMLNYILNAIIQVGVFALFVIFQPELRMFLEKLGRSRIGKIIDFAAVGTGAETSSYTLEEIRAAVGNMARSKTGALIVIERKTKLGDTMRSGTRMDATVSAALIENIFVPKTPLHDGAVIIRGNKIISAGCVLPLTSNDNLSRELGTRHRAAMGISEVSDALIVVVSEETGKISLAVNGGLTRNLSDETLMKAFERFMSDSFSEPLEKIKFWKTGTKEGGAADEN